MAPSQKKAKSKTRVKAKSSSPALPPTTQAEDLLKLREQVCFPLYAASRMMIQLYKPHLDPLGLTYPQYLVLMVLWEEDGLSVKDIGDRLYLDSATVIQVLNKLEKRELLSRERADKLKEPAGDGRVVINHLTKKGRELKSQAKNIPLALSCEFGSQVGEVEALRPLLFNFVKILSDKI